jgi:hypothetical protein
LQFTPELVRHHFAEAFDIDKFHIPESFDDNTAKVMALRGSDSAVMSEEIEKCSL